jgi:hypothetical protein
MVLSQEELGRKFLCSLVLFYVLIVIKQLFSEVVMSLVTKHEMTLSDR